MSEVSGARVAEQAAEIERLKVVAQDNYNQRVKTAEWLETERTAREKPEREIERLRGEVFALTDRLIRCLDVNERQGGVALELTDALTRETAEIKAREKAERERDEARKALVWTWDQQDGSFEGLDFEDWPEDMQWICAAVRSARGEVKE